MAVLTFDPARGNFIEAEGQASWFMATFEDGRTYVVPDRCPHRGGPLRLGTTDTAGQAVSCPWHDNAVSVRWLRKQALPLIRRQGGSWTVIVPENVGPTRMTQRTVLLVDTAKNPDRETRTS